MILLLRKKAFNFCDGCDGEFEVVAEWESDMQSKMAQYADWY